MQPPSHVLRHGRLATLAPGAAGTGLVDDGAIVVAGGRIAWAGPDRDLPAAGGDLPITDLAGRLVTPALVDCHTHLVFGGDRAREFELRLEGATYEELARAGGGIVSTVKATRAASEDDLVAGALRRLDRLLAEGLGCVEVKSGYGLDLETELKMLRAARRLGRERNLRVRTTFLGAHAVPPEYADRADAYIDFVCGEVMPAVAAEGLADAVDAFCENIGFTPDQTRRVFEAARNLGLPVKLHAEQLTDQGGAALAASFGALSADHLEYLGADGIDAMAAAGTVAVLLPGAFYVLRETRLPPVDALRAAGVPMAIATDCNPGSSPVASILLMLNMACTLFRLTPAEALAGVTREAARALGLGGEIGTIDAGKAADLAVWDADNPADLAYWVGMNPLHARYVNGEVA
ncbi:MAG: imidazolonepropionase [Hyphomicrobiales bacterium]|nr:imidazolonepropionase [Hyphomicrobiales bacterium]MCP5372267.1 imidazolonepropionase [Hyphomicrobiales bacterium]